MKILCVDDSITIHAIVKTSLSLIDGAQVLTAKLPSIGWKTLEEEGTSIDLILLDWNMPEMTGLDFLKKVKAKEEWKDIPVVMLTSEGSKDSMTKALDSGAYNYITKPFSQEDLVNTVMQTLGQSMF